MTNYIFISYAHKDSERVLLVIKKLQENGYNVWYDDGIDPGTEWAKNISKHIVECSYFIAFMSQAYLDSKNCNEEWHFARDEEKKRFLVYIEDVKLPDDMRMRSSMIQNLFMHKYSDKEEFYRKLFAAEGIEVCKNAEPEGEIERGAVEAVEEYEETPKTQEEEKKAEVVKSFRNILYTDDGETVTIVGCKEETKSLSIPQEIKRMSVVAISENAFKENVNLVTMSLSKSVTKIGESAFKDCINLTTVEGICKECVISADAFDGCVKLKRNPLQMEDWEWNFEILELKDEITICKCLQNVEEIKIPKVINGKPVTEIEDYAFESCDCISRVEIPKEVKKIGFGAFSKCTSLSDIEIPKGVTEIEAHLFEGCSNLSSVVIPESVKEIGVGAFEGCISLKSVAIPESVERIGVAAFSGCSGLTNIDIPRSVIGLNDHLFWCCSKLRNITIPENIKYIGSYVFWGCESLFSVEYSGKNRLIRVAKEMNQFIEWEEYRKERKIQEDVTVISSDAFALSSASSVEQLDEITCEMFAMGGHEKAKGQMANKYFEQANNLLKNDNEKKDGKTIVIWYEKAAGYGHVEAQYKVADIYMKGEIVETDEKKAFEYFQKAAENGHEEAKFVLAKIHYRMAEMYMKGEHVEKNEKKAIEHYEKAAQNGHAEAQYMMAEMYEEGGILEKNEKKALRFYRKSAKNGNIEAQEKIISMFVTGEETEIDELEIKQMYYNFLENSDEKKVQRFFYVLRINMVLYSGADEKETIFEGWTRELAEKENVFAQLIMAYLAEDERHFEEAIKWYQKVAKKGDVRIQYKLGSLFEQEGDVQEAVMWYQKAAEKGHKKAQNQVGQLYDKLKERDDAIKWYQVVEQQGDVDVQYRLGQLFEEKQDWLNAVRYYQKAAENDVVEAQCKMAFNALDGKGMKKDMSEAVKWYKKAVDNKNTIAEFGLAMLHLTGRGVEQDFDKAHELFQCAAKQEHSIACLMLALLYGTGRGVEQDDDMARHWCERACAKGKWNKNDIPYESGKQYRLIEINEWVNRIFRDVEVLQEDLALALEWHFDTAEESDAVACCNLGYMHEMGWGVEPDRKKAMEWYQKAVEVGDSNAARLLKRCKKSTGWGKILGIFS